MAKTQIHCNECEYTNTKVYDNLKTFRCGGCDTLYIKRDGIWVLHVSDVERPEYVSSIRPTVDVRGDVVKVSKGCERCECDEVVGVVVVYKATPHPFSRTHMMCQEHLTPFRKYLSMRVDVLEWHYALAIPSTPSDVIMMRGNMIDTLFSDGPAQWSNPDAHEYVDQGDQPKHNPYRRHPHQVMMERRRS